MQLPKEILTQLLGNTDFVSGLSALIKALTGLANWCLIVLVTTGLYKAILEIASWFK